MPSFIEDLGISKRRFLLRMHYQRLVKFLITIVLKESPGLNPACFCIKEMFRRKIEHFLKKHKYEKLGFSEMN